MFISCISLAILFDRKVRMLRLRAAVDRGGDTEPDAERRSHLRDLQRSDDPGGLGGPGAVAVH